VLHINTGRGDRVISFLVFIFYLKHVISLCFNGVLTTRWLFFLVQSGFFSESTSDSGDCLLSHRLPLLISLAKPARLSAAALLLRLALVRSPNDTYDICPETFAQRHLPRDICPYDVCPEGHLPRRHATFAQKDICPERHLPGRHLPRSHLPRNTFAHKEICPEDVCL
jgi:hypothetical protein